jgi:preprotein translocase subunit SecF
MRRTPSITVLTCGVAVLALGVLLVLGAGGTIDLRFAYTVPVVVAALGAVLLASGLASRRRGRG